MGQGQCDCVEVEEIGELSFKHEQTSKKIAQDRTVKPTGKSENKAWYF